MVINVLLLRMHTCRFQSGFNRVCSCLGTSVRFITKMIFCFIVFIICFYYLLCMTVLYLCCLSGVIKNNNNNNICI